MKVLLLGSGGREHAIAWKIAQRSHLEHLFIAPGNAGPRQHGTNVPIGVNDFEKIKAFVLENEIRFDVVSVLFDGKQVVVEHIPDAFYPLLK